VIDLSGSDGTAFRFALNAQRVLLQVAAPDGLKLAACDSLGRDGCGDRHARGLHADSRT